MPPTVVPWFIAIVFPEWNFSDRRFRKMAEWCLRFTPRVHIEEMEFGREVHPQREAHPQRATHSQRAAHPRLLILDLSGCLRLHGGAQRIGLRIVRGLKRRGIHHAIGSDHASGPAVIRAMGAACGVPCALSILDHPINCLRLPEAIFTGLREVNLTRIGQAHMIQSSALADRFGPLMCERLEQALGARPWKFQAIVPTVSLQGIFQFHSPCAQHEAVERAWLYAIEELCVSLAAADRGVRVLRVQVARARLAPVVGRVHLGVASTDPRHLWSILRPRVERIHLGHHELGEGLEQITLTAERTSRRQGGTPLLGGEIGRAAAVSQALRSDLTHQENDRRAATERAIGELIDHVHARLGDGAVRAPLWSEGDSHGVK